MLNITTSAKFILLTEQNKCSVQLTCRIFIIFIVGFKSSILHKFDLRHERIKLSFETK